MTREPSEHIVEMPSGRVVKLSHGDFVRLEKLAALDNMTVESWFLAQAEDGRGGEV